MDGKKVRFIIVASMWLSTVFCCCSSREQKNIEPNNIVIEVFAASKCERAADLFSVLVPIIQQLEDRVHVNIDYVGNEKDGIFVSLLGDMEIQGDILGLCADRSASRAQQLMFVSCMYKNWKKIPKDWELCATEASIPLGLMDECFKGENGKKLLRRSFIHSEKKATTRGPTVYINDSEYEGRLTEPSLGRALCNLLDNPKPQYCSKVPLPVEVTVTVVKDKRCRDQSCETRRIVSTIEKNFEGARIKEFDYSDPQGKKLFEKTKKKYLPVIIFSADIKRDQKGYQRMLGYLHSIEGNDDLVYPLGTSWNPVAEICDDSIDNDGNGATDCDDNLCREKPMCRPEKKNSITLFAMTHCSYSVRALDMMAEVLKNFDNDRKKIDFEINYVGNEIDGELFSIHGKAATEEAIRSLCAQKYYKEDYLFMQYILCRNKMYWNSKGMESEDVNWQLCAKNKIKATEIKKCAESDEGKRLLSASFKNAENFNISGSPRWVVNDKNEISAVSAETLKNAFCERNNIEECAAKLSSESVLIDYCGGRPRIAK